MTGIVQQAGDRNNVLVDLGKVEALLPRSEQVDGERYEQGSRIKAVITEVRSGTKGPQVILSRRDPELIKTLFELEVPEIADGLVEIRGVAREPGYRSKIAVESHAQGVDPVGACVGPRGSRVRMVVSELRGEKIDIIPWNQEPARFVAKALSPARVREVYLDDEGKEATVVVPDDQLALAIGKEGMNARLAARLTGWKIDIQSDTEFAQAEAEAAFGGGDGEARRGLLRPLLRDPLERQALPERRAARLASSAASRRTRSSPHEADDEEPSSRGRAGARGARRQDEPDARASADVPSSRPSDSRRRPSRGHHGRTRSQRRGRGAVDLDRHAEAASARRRVPAGHPGRADARRSLRRRGAAADAAPAAAGGRRSASCSVSPPATAPSSPAVPSPAAAPTRAAASRASSARPTRGMFARVLRQQVPSRSRAATPLHWREPWLTEATDRTARSARAAAAAPADAGGASSSTRAGSAPSREQRQAAPGQPSAASRAPPAPPPTGPVSVESGVSVRDLSQALGVPMLGDHQVPDGPRTS